MEDIKLLIIVVAVIIIIGLVFYILSRRKSEKGIFIGDMGADNKRNNLRLSLDIENAQMEVVKIGDRYVNRKHGCEVVDLSVSGMGIYTYSDYPTDKPVLVRVSFMLNNKEFSVDGEIVRKAKDQTKPLYFYGVNFTNLLPGDEYKLIKEIFTIINNRRQKVTIK